MDHGLMSAADLSPAVRSIVRGALTKRGVPYQSVYYRGQPLVMGERKEVLSRHEMVRADDLRDRTVIDMGCNIGASAFLAHEAGAWAVQGWDRDPVAIGVARALATLFGYPVAFHVRDVAHPPPGAGPWHTGFAFSVARHADVRPVLGLCRVVYAETNIKDGKRLRPEFTEAEGWVPERLGTTSAGGRLVYRLTRAG